MKIYDISQEVFNCKVFPGDPAPERMCAHNGTHVDAPFHFVRDGKTIDEVNLEAAEVFAGACP